MLRVFLHGADVFPETLRVVEEIGHAAGGGVEAVAGAGVVKTGNGGVYLFLHAAVFLLVVKGAVLEDDVLALGDIQELHALGDGPV